MQNKLFVGSLAYTVTDQELKDLFAPFGNVVSAKVITDRDSGQSKGFGFVEFEGSEEAKAAIAALNGKEVNGRQLTVNVAKPMGDRPNRGGGHTMRSRY
jgi:cold-inducible RNA-binding protein